LKKLNILVTGVAGDIGSGAVKILNKLNYHSKLLGMDFSHIVAVKSELDFLYVSPHVSDSKKYLNFLEKLIDNHSVNLIVPTSEMEIYFFSSNIEYFEIKSIKILVHNIHLIEQFSNSLKTHLFLKKIGLNSPMTHNLSDYRKLNFPYYLKRNNSSGSKGVIKIENEKDLFYYRDKFPDSSLQEIIGTPDNEYTTTIFKGEEDLHWITFKRYLGYGGLSKYIHLVDFPKINSYVKIIASKLSFEGSINFQFRLNNAGEIFTFDINPRLSSTLIFKNYFGFQDLKWWIDLKFNKSPKINYKIKYIEGLGIRTLTEYYYDLKLNGDE
jgi:carbamoyl-phosphate synthase large subunit